MPLLACAPQRASLVHLSPNTAVCSDAGATSMLIDCGPSEFYASRATIAHASASGSGAPSPGQAFLIALGIGLIVGIVILLHGGTSGGQ